MLLSKELYLKVCELGEMLVKEFDIKFGEYSINFKIQDGEVIYLERKQVDKERMR